MPPTATDEPLSTEVPADALDLHESAVILRESDASGAIQPDGTIKLHIIRPTVGKGRGRHLYEAKMLEENAGKFTGWKMYLNHLSPEAKKAAAGLPRRWEDFAGYITESTWDPSVPADPKHGFEQGAVVGVAKPFGLAKKLADEMPEVLEASISTNATGVRPATRDGQRVWAVEGIADRGSVDFVTEAGAGGRVVTAIQEAAEIPEEDMLVEALGTLSDDQFKSYLRDNRPELLEALASERGGASGDTPTNQGGIMGDLTPEQLQEALQSDTVAEHVAGLVRDQAQPLVEAALAEERDRIREQARADSDRQLQLRDLKDTAHQMIAESKLPTGWKEELKSRFAITEFGPTEALDVYDEIGESGEVEKSAESKLREAVESEIGRQRQLLAEARPTRVTGQGGGGSSREIEEGKTEPGKGGEAPKRYSHTLAGSILEEAGLDAETAWKE